MRSFVMLNENQIKRAGENLVFEASAGFSDEYDDDKKLRNQNKFYKWLMILFSKVHLLILV